MLRAASSASILIVGQAPGRRVHESGVPWSDPSGVRLRSWLDLDEREFYDEKRIAIVPMGFCYPGTGKSGDRPPRPECAPLWHARLRALLPNVGLTLLVGKYAHAFYLRERQGDSLTETVRAFRDYLPDFVPLVHPSPRNTAWLQRNPWFEQEVLPFVRGQVARLLGKSRHHAERR